MSLSERVDSDIKTAMKKRDDVRLVVLRMLKSELKYKSMSIGNELSDEDAIAVLSSAAKKRSEAIMEYRKGGREDLEKLESIELEILKEYLPEQLSESDLKFLVEKAVVETGASSINDLGLVMKTLMPDVRGKADGKTVNNVVRTVLQSK